MQGTKHLAHRLRFLLLSAVVGVTGMHSLHAEDVLFIGNSLTRAVPKSVELIAKSKKKDLSTGIRANSGKAWDFHLKNPETAAILTEKKWHWVVLQDLSDRPTHIGNLKGFRADGEALYKKVRELAPQATVVLYETWAADEGHKVYGPASTADTFANRAEMSAELTKNYEELAATLETLEPGKQVLLAPVGRAFARSSELYPEVALMVKDHKHPTTEGNYLASMVIYATLTGDSSPGPGNASGGSVTPEDLAKLKKVAEETMTNFRSKGLVEQAH